MISHVEQWRLVDFYIDIASAKTKSVRKDFVRIFEDCKVKKTDIIITKSLSRFGRDTVDTLESLKELRDADKFDEIEVCIDTRKGVSEIEL